MLRIAEVGFAMRLVSILDHFIAAALENDSALRKAEFAANSNLSESGCEVAMSMPRNFSKIMSPAPRRPIALVTVPGMTLSAPSTLAIADSLSTPFDRQRMGGIFSANTFILSKADAVSNDLSANSAASNGP